MSFCKQTRRNKFEATALGDFYHAAGFNAGRADQHFLGAPIIQGPDTLQIGIETPLGYIMGVADIIANDRFFSTYFTYFRHIIFSCNYFFKMFR